jgi:pimeloyl-ACP methyl ester carboxylesterase
MLALPATQQPSDQISVPVLVAVGADDNLFCTGVTAYNCDSAAPVQAFESQYYSPAAHLKVVTIPGIGHDLALSTTAPITDAGAFHPFWNDTRTGQLEIFTAPVR